MADFCNQCAKEMGLWQGVSDYPKREPPREGYGYMEICEGCGGTLVDGEGNCIGKHEIKSVKHA